MIIHAYTSRSFGICWKIGITSRSASRRMCIRFQAQLRQQNEEARLKAEARRREAGGWWDVVMTQKVLSGTESQ